MSIRGFLFIALALAVQVAFVIGLALYRRIPMERRARALLAEFPNGERTSVYLEFRSSWPSAKQREMDAKIAEMQSAGWIFLRGTMANPLRTIRSWGGGLMLHFIRKNSSESPHAA